MLKKYILVIFFVFGIQVLLSAQEYSARKCASEIIHNHKLATDPEYKQNYTKVEENTRNYWKNSERKASQGVRVIPIYVHVVYNEAKPEENISDAQIQSQIDVINLDFRKLNADVGNVPEEFAHLVTDYELEFELAGITRKASEVTEWGFSNDVKRSSAGGVDPITPETHLNIWVCEIGDETLGYAQFPGGDPLTDGVVNGGQFFGTKNATGSENFYLAANYDEGRTLTHEIGHYLNLYHIWGDGDCNADDEVEDTPPAAADNGGCPAYPTKSCESNPYTSDMFMNYMDYVNDACMFMFTEGQKARTTPIFAPGGARENLGYIKDDGCSLAAPSNILASNIADTEFTITWDAVADAASYDISLNGDITNVTTTSYTYQSLTIATNYEVKIRATCAEGGSGSFSTPISVTTTGCPAGPATLTINPDNYGSEITWSLKYESAVVASGGPYTDGNTDAITQTIDFGEGNYEFTINDSESDGICCGFGNGSYTITDVNANVITSGAEYGAGETKAFCLQNSSQKQNQVLTIDPIADKKVNDADFAVNATVDSGLELAYAVSSGPATISGNMISLAGVSGTVVVQVSQAGNETFNSVSSTVSFNVNKVDQVLTIEPIEDKSIDDPDFEIVANVDTGLDLSYSLSGPATLNGNTVSLSGDAGTVVIEVSQAGNETYNPVSDNVSFEVIDLCASFTAEVSAINDVSCNGLEDGSFTIVAEGGSNNYTYSLNDATQTLGEFNEVAAGVYFVTVTDDNDCSVEVEIEVTEPDPIIVEANIENNTSIDGNGRISTSVSGGDGQYSFEWSTGETVASLSNLMPGEYILTVTDGNNCSIEETFVVGGITSNSKIMPENVIVFPNPTKEKVIIQHPDLELNAEIKIYDAKGVLIETIVSGKGGTEINMNYRVNGLYFIQLEHKNGFIRIVKE